MRIIKTVFKIFVISIILVAIIIAGAALYMKFYGKNLLENALSNMLGSKVKFESVALNLNNPGLDFKGFSIQSKIDFDQDIFNAEKCTIILDEEKLKKDKKIVIDQIIVKKGILNIERNKSGIFNVSRKSPDLPCYKNSVAYADEPEAMALYKFAKYVRKLSVKDSVIKFKDYYISDQPFTIDCDNFNLGLTFNQESESASGAIPATCTVGFRIPSNRYGDGQFLLNTNMAICKYMLNMELTAETKYIDLMQFLPYFEKYTPFSFNDGLCSSTTNFRMHNRVVDSLTTMEFHRLRLIIDPGMKNAQFLDTSINRLAPYLTSRTGGLIFDFVIKGPADNPQIGIGPQVKFAIGRVVIEELGNFIQQLQKLQK